MKESISNNGLELIVNDNNVYYEGHIIYTGKDAGIWATRVVNDDEQVAYYLMEWTPPKPKVESIIEPKVESKEYCNTEHVNIHVRMLPPSKIYKLDKFGFIHIYVLNDDKVFRYGVCLDFQAEEYEVKLKETIAQVCAWFPKNKLITAVANPAVDNYKKLNKSFREWLKQRSVQ